jgi:hypothetical protein
MIEDGATCAINCTIKALRILFSDTSEQPPLGGGTREVRLFAGDGAPLSAWNAHHEGCGCAEPFIWVRLARRYRTQQLPAAYSGSSPCDVPAAVAIEMGVARCAVVDAEPGWNDYADEAEISLDDAWRIECAMCLASQYMRAEPCTITATATDVIVPFGPEGGVIAWVGTMYAQL